MYSSIKDAEYLNDIEVIIVGGSSRIPKAQELVNKIFGKEPNKGVNPDEVVASWRWNSGWCIGW